MKREETIVATVRDRWRRVRTDLPVDALRLGVLASYTADPLVPHLGLGLSEAGLPAQVDVGPFNRIVPECVDDDGETARRGADVLVVVPRFEELGEHAPATWADELLRVAEAAAGAARRRGCGLLFVLPAVPETRPGGVGDAGSPGGVVAHATRAREAVRRRLAGTPGVDLADAEEVVRAVGSRHAYHPVLYRYAKVPYTEELFAHLGAQLVRVLRTRYGRGPRATVVDADSMLGGEGAAEGLRLSLRELTAGGLQLAVRGSRDSDALWATLAAELPELLDAVVVDDRPVAVQLATLAADLDVAAERLALLTCDPTLTDAVVLTGPPETWPPQLRDAGLLDRAPEPVTEVPDVSTAAVAAPPTLAEFTAGLGVVVTYLPVGPSGVDRVAELVERTKGFSLGIPHTAADLAGRTADLLAVAVRDRYGDYGTAAAVGMHTEDGVGTVDLFSVSCTVLGKDVEEAVVGELVERCAAAGCATLTFRYRATGHNDGALTFLRAAQIRAWQATDGSAVRIGVEIAEGATR